MVSAYTEPKQSIDESKRPKQRHMRDPEADDYKVGYLFGAAAVLALLFTHKYTFLEICWTFSIWLESVAILPQLHLTKKETSVENFTSGYIIALALYRGFYIPNWIYRYFFEIPPYVDLNAWVAGIIQTALYINFFRLYHQKWVVLYSVVASLQI